MYFTFRICSQAAKYYYCAQCIMLLFSAHRQHRLYYVARTTIIREKTTNEYDDGNHDHETSKVRKILCIHAHNRGYDSRHDFERASERESSYELLYLLLLWHEKILSNLCALSWVYLEGVYNKAHCIQKLLWVICKMNVMMMAMTMMWEYYAFGLAEKKQ